MIQKDLKNSIYIRVLALLLIFLISLTMISACQTEATDYSSEIAHINEAMSDVPRLVEISLDNRNFSELSENGLAFYDDWYEYCYDEGGYLSMAVLSSERLTVVYEQNKKYAMKPTEDEIKSGVEINLEERALHLAEIIEGLNERALQFHMTNMKNYLAQDRDIKSSMGGMGEVIITINELTDGKPAGVSSSITYAVDGTLIGLAVYCQPIDDSANTNTVSMEKALQIAYDDVFERYKEVLLPMDLLELKWTAERSTHDGKSVWKIELGGLVRKDFPEILQEFGWSVKYYVHSKSGKILARLEAA